MVLKASNKFTSVIGVAAVVIALAVAGCSDPNGGRGSGDANADAAPQGAAENPTFPEVPEAMALLPDKFKKSGVLRATMPTNEVPTQFYRQGTKEMTGINPDTARLVAGALGLDLQIEVAKFDSIIPGLQADRYDIAVASMTPTKERMETLDFVEYINMGSALAVPVGNPKEIGPETLCGQRVGALIGSYQLRVRIPEVDATCETAGKPKTEILQYQDTSEALGALSSGRADVVYQNAAILNYAATQNDQIEISAVLNVDPVGIGIPRESGLTDAIAAAMEKIIVSDQYMAMLKSYNVEDLALDKVQVNVPQ
ncbi:transporter substrate-binding domain-containing protein [Leucobacter sp. wl10]|uniref:transporter substrate-binding domain-containing protein n=1 Tax=Leucobacter sp. wl10 TaxID=2304677 RepID=UPI000E5BCB61|nr:transporter substrate-binding domain-containing protein [Leucobacter sp. wl10]RGE15852.1 ABC transporter substrate-binding protein [Leucobacter sp. wl10]